MIQRVLKGRTFGRAARDMATGDTATIAGTIIFMNVLRIGGSMVLTRLLNAEAFGIVGIVTSVAVTFGLISDIGVSAFVVRHAEGHEKRFLDEVWTLRLIRGIVLTSAMAALSQPIANLIGKPEIALVLAFGSLWFVGDAIASMAFVTALRDRAVKTLSLIDVVATVATLVASVCLAIIFRNYWGILIANLFGQLLKAALSFALFPNSSRRLRFSIARARELWGFSRFIAGSTFITLILGQTDKLVLSRLFSLHTLGLYTIASNIATAPAGLAYSYVARVVYPGLAQAWREYPERLRDEFYGPRVLTSALYTFAVGGVIACAPLIVHILYDKRYVDAALYIQLLSLSTLLMLNTQANSELMIAMGKTLFSLQANIARLVYLAIGGIAAYHFFGVIGLVTVVGSLELPAQLFGWWTLQREHLIRWRFELLFLATGAVGAAIGWVVCQIGLTLLG